jgi:NAD(P)-dependent dehydrogenase (short-subunit alcohol dehydrogenase family)
MTARNLGGGCALVTGGSSGIGRAICQALAQAGLRVLLTGRSAARCEETRAQLPGPEPHQSLVGDLADDAFVSQLVTRARQLAPRGLSVLVHAAGNHVPQAIEATSAAELDATLSTNLRAPFLLSAGLLASLRLARGQVVFINSSAINNPRADVAAYAASKAGLRAFADSLRASVNADGVRVLSVFPGRTASPMQREQFEREGRPYKPELLLQPEDVATAVVAALALPETAELTELHLRPNLKS